MVHRLPLAPTTSLPVASVHTLVSKIDITPGLPAVVGSGQSAGEIRHPPLHTRALLHVDSRLAPLLLLWVVVLRVRVVVHNLSPLPNVLWRAAAVVIAVAVALRVVGFQDVVSVFVVSPAVRSVRTAVAGRVVPVKGAYGASRSVKALAAFWGSVWTVAAAVRRGRIRPHVVLSRRLAGAGGGWV